MIENNTIVNLYKSIYALKRYGDFSLLEIHTMFPYEIDIYTAMTKDAIDKDKERIKG